MVDTLCHSIKNNNKKKPAQPTTKKKRFACAAAMNRSRCRSSGDKLRKESAWPSGRREAAGGGGDEWVSLWETGRYYFQPNHPEFCSNAFVTNGNLWTKTSFTAART